ncbi:hypothetical protein MRX96_034337 [Rhipicephalus microplus]
MKSCGSLRRSLQEVSGQLQIERVGLQHQAGSDSLLTGVTFFKIRKLFFQDKLDDSQLSGFLHSLDTSYGTYGEQMFEIIHLGIRFFDEHGNKHEHISIWQFSFKCCLSKDTFAQDSIDLLVQSGINFHRHEEERIEPFEFVQLLITSGLVLSDEFKWLTFHTGYDFGYLLEMLTGENLPVAETDFFETLKLYFPCIYDIMYLMKSCGSLRRSLQEVSGQLQIERVGLQHQAGSDSLLTGVTFFKIRKLFFQDKLDDSQLSGFLHSLDTSYGTYGEQMFEVRTNSRHNAQMLSRFPLVVYSTPVSRNVVT